MIGSIYSKKMAKTAISAAFLLRNVSDMVYFLLDITALGYDLYSQAGVICDDYWVSCGSEYGLSLLYED